jgi:hypothetical protein
VSVPIKGISPFSFAPRSNGVFFIPDTRFPSEGGEDHEVEGRVDPTIGIQRSLSVDWFIQPPSVAFATTPHTGENLAIPIMKVCL